MKTIELFNAVRALGLTIKCTDGEYRVALKGVSPAAAERSAYYTNDRDDAFATAQAMAIDRDFPLQRSVERDADENVTLHFQRGEHHAVVWYNRSARSWVTYAVEKGTGYQRGDSTYVYTKREAISACLFGLADALRADARARDEEIARGSGPDRYPTLIRDRNGKVCDVG